METKKNHNEPKLNIEGVSQQDLKRSAFKAPEGYFDNLTPRVMESVRTSEVAEKATWPVWMQVLTPSMGIAAVVFAVWFFMPPTQNKTEDFNEVLATMTIEELTLYADVEPTELVAYELVEYNEIALEDLSDEELLHYLETEEQVDINTLMNEIEI
jgi:hypothetical protein